MVRRQFLLCNSGVFTFIFAPRGTVGQISSADSPPLHPNKCLLLPNQSLLLLPLQLQLHPLDPHHPPLTWVPVSTNTSLP